MIFDFTALLNTIATLFMLLMVGFLAAKVRIIDEVSSKKLSDFVLKIGNPFLIINAVIGVEFSFDNLKMGFFTLGAGILVHILMAVIAFLIASRIKNHNERKITEFTMVFGNVGFIGLPILNSLFGAQGLFFGAFIVVGFNIFIWTWGVSIIARGRNDVKLTVKKIFLNYGTVPSLIGLVIYLAKYFIELPSFVYTSTSYLASICTPITMIITGALLARRTVSQIFFTPKVYLVVAVKLIAVPLLVCTLASLFGLSDMWVLFFTTIIAMPSAAMVSMFASVYDINPDYAAQIVGTTSLLAMGTIPLVLWIAQQIMVVI